MCSIATCRLSGDLPEPSVVSSIISAIRIHNPSGELLTERVLRKTTSISLRREARSKYKSFKRSDKYKCTTCDVWCNSAASHKEHNNGGKHKTGFSRATEECSLVLPAKLLQKMQYELSHREVSNMVDKVLCPDDPKILMSCLKGSAYIAEKTLSRRDFYTASMRNGEKMMVYINRVRQMALTLESMNVTIDDKELAMAVLNGLPERYQSIITALDAIGDEDASFTFDKVRSRLLQEEM
eukprot:IDg5101t1